MGGLFQATASGFLEFKEHLDDETLLRFGVDNGAVEGAVAASGRFFEELAGVSRQVYEDLRATRTEAYPPIDYEKLGRIVARELRNPSPPPPPSATVGEVAARAKEGPPVTAPAGAPGIITNLNDPNLTPK